MQKLRQKEIQELRLQQQKTRHAYKHALDVLLHQQTLRILIQYCKQQLKSIDVSKIQSINDYSPVSISRLIFSKQLKQIKAQLNKLPNNHKCPLEHFLLIMLKLIKFPFEKTPLYLLGLKEMFRQIKEDQRQNCVSYQQIQKYVLGEVVNFNDQSQIDTQFEIQFSQNKMQDFLMHDNGINKIFFSHDLKKYIVLDQNSNILKIYDENMKIVAKFQPNKQKHNKKHPTILTFDYNQLGSKLALSLSDGTFSIVNLTNFLRTDSEETFRLVFLNQVCYKSNRLINQIYYLSMMNKWLCIDQANEIWIYDVDKFKQENQVYSKKFKHPNDDFQIKQVLQIVSLATIAFVINNQIWFYNETLSSKKFKKFSHCEQIIKFTYEENKSQFYLFGKQEKYITIFTLNKITGQANKIWTYQTNQVIRDFDVFSYCDSLLVLDIQNNLKVYPQKQAILQYQQNYQLIVKKKQLPIKLVKTSKSQFLIHSTYILVMELKKVAIQRDMDFNFLQAFFYDHSKQEICFSVNGQIMGLSLMHGQIRKSLASQNSNLDKHKAFYMGKSTQLFVIDLSDSLHQIYSKNDQRFKLNRDHKKAVGITGTKKSFYDEQSHMILMMNDSSLYIVRNDSQNNFTLKSCLLLENFPIFIKQKYYPNSKQLLFQDSTNLIYLMNTYNYEITKILKIQVFKQQNQAQKMILDIQYEQELKVLMILTNTGEFILIDLNDSTKTIYIKLTDILPYKLKSLIFTSFSYQKTEKDNKKLHSRRVFFFNQTGFLIQFQIDKILRKIVIIQQPNQPNIRPAYIKDTHQLDRVKLLASTDTNNYKVNKSNLYTPQVPKQANFIKVHQKSIAFSRRVFIEGYLLLTIGQDGHLKLWGQNRKLYFDLKLPLMHKIQWNMNQLHQKRNIRTICQINEFLLQAAKKIKVNQDRQILHIENNKKKLRNKSEKIKINFDNPIAIQFQNKDLEQLVTNRKQIDISSMTINVDQLDKRSPRDISKRMTLTQRISQPWKKKTQFHQIYQKASPVDKYLQKYKEKMPYDLLLMRNDLHIGENIPTKRKNLKVKQENLFILPELKNYLKNLKPQKQKIKNNPEDNRDEDNSKAEKNAQQNKFESCLFVKTQRGPKKANAFDQIDKYFHKKEQQLLNKKWVPNKRNLTKQHMTLEPETQNSLLNHYQKSSELGKGDPLKSVIKIFEQHNKETLNSKKGRLINIPLLGSNNRKSHRKKLKFENSLG